MDIGIGLPSAVPGAGGEQIVDWARVAEERGFSSLGVIDRLVYGTAEPLVTLAAAAAVTRRVRLVTSILLAPLRVNAALLAKQAASVNHLSSGRLLLGMAVGGYADDYEASAVPFHERGRRFDRMLGEMARVWAGEPMGFAGPIGPPSGLDRSQIGFGGQSARVYARVAEWGGTWIGGSRGVEGFARGAERVQEAWTAQGRPGRPRLMAVPYFSLGPDAESNAEAFLTDFYAVEGEVGPSLASGAITGPARLRDTVAAYEQAGCDELILLPCSADPGQVHLLADALSS